MPTIEGPYPENPYRENGNWLPLVPIRLKQPVSSMAQIAAAGGTPLVGLSAWALLDTGSGGNGVDHEVIKKLCLIPVDTASATTPNGKTKVRRFVLDVSVDGADFETILVAEMALKHLGSHLLLGVDWLRKRTFTLDGPANRFTVSW